MLAARASDVRIANRAADSRQQMRGRDRDCRRQLQHVALRDVRLDELEPALTVARQHDRVTVLSVGEADERVVGKHWRKAARELSQRHRLAVAVGERRRAVPADDIDVRRTAARVWINGIATNLI